jgi:glutaredoxin
MLSPGPLLALAHNVLEKQTLSYIREATSCSFTAGILFAVSAPRTDVGVTPERGLHSRPQILHGTYMAIIRWLLGSLILMCNWVFTPKSIKRNAQLQAKINEQTEQLTLYQYKACPFCVKVRRAMKRHSLNIETRDAKRSDSAKDELLAGGGQLKVPCLKVSKDSEPAQWIYESGDIIGYLEGRFAAS